MRTDALPLRRDMLVALTGIGGGQILLLAATPFLAREYGPSAFGAYSAITLVAGIVATISALRMDLAIVGAPDRDLHAVVRVSFLLPGLVVPAAIGVLALSCMTWWGTALPFEPAALPLVGFIALFQGLATVGSAVGTRLGAFSTVAAMKIVQPLFFTISALFVVHDLAVAMVFGWIAALLISTRSLRGISFFSGWQESQAAAIHAWRLPAMSAPMALLDTLALALPVLVIASCFGDKEAGNLSQVQRLIGAPLMLIAMASSQVLIKYAGEKLRGEEPIMPLIIRFLSMMSGVCAAFLIAVILVGQPVLEFLLGPEWRTDRTFLLVVLMPIIFRSVASPISVILVLTDRISLLAKWQIGHFLSTVATLTAGVRWLGFDGILMALAANELLMYGVYLHLSTSVARQPFQKHT